jgi:hypothetical protein
MGEREAYERMRSSLDEAYEQAERLVHEATRDVPARGWRSPPEEPRPSPEHQALLGLLDLARSAVPAEITRQLLDALRELLLAVRALIDWYLERLDRRRPEPPEVEDIPIQ